MKSIKERFFPQILVIYSRYFIGGSFVFASVIKIKGKRFVAYDSSSTPVDSLWHMFETLYQSGLYWQFIGMAQLIAGLLLMTQKFSKLGALLNLPIIANVFVITISYDFGFTGVITGFMLMINLALFAWDWNSFKIFFNRRPEPETKNRIEHQKIWQLLGLILFCFTFVYRIFVDRYDAFFWTAGCLIIGIAGLIIGLNHGRKKLAKADL